MVRYVIGIDEVGRGPLAGPICVGAVLVPQKLSWKDFRGLKDSKKLSAKQREEWAARVACDPRLKSATAMVSAAVIDEKGIVYAAKTAVARALNILNEFVRRESLGDAAILLDAGLRAPAKFTNQISLVRGDETEVPIALASIMAKVARDRLMVRLAKRYPKYGFESHKGYGTAFHRRVIRKSGLCEIHRRSFCTRLHISHK